MTLERDPTSDELLKEGIVYEELHGLPTPTPMAIEIKQDAIEAERKVQAELQRIADQGARDRAQMPSWAEGARRVSIDKQNKFATVTKALMRAGIGTGGDEGEHFIKPEGPSYETPQASTGFAVASKGRRRIAKAELPQRRTLLVIGNAIRAAIAKGDKTEAGRLLLEAKAILGYGGFLPWVEREAFGVTSRTLQNWMAAAE
jgi:hypothetical protein